MVTVTPLGCGGAELDNECIRTDSDIASRLENQCDLQDEWHAAWSVAGVKSFNWLSDAGVSDAAIWQDVQVIGRARVLTEPNGFYQPHPDGRAAFIAPIAASYFWGNELVLEDLASWFPSDPGRVYSRLGNWAIANSYA